MATAVATAVDVAPPLNEDALLEARSKAVIAAAREGLSPALAKKYVRLQSGRYAELDEAEAAAVKAFEEALPPAPAIHPAKVRVLACPRAWLRARASCSGADMRPRPPPPHPPTHPPAHPDCATDASTLPPIFQTSSNPARDDAELQAHTLGVGCRGRAPCMKCMVVTGHCPCDIVNNCLNGLMDLQDASPAMLHTAAEMRGVTVDELLEQHAATIAAKWEVRESFDKVRHAGDQTRLCVRAGVGARACARARWSHMGMRDPVCVCTWVGMPRALTRRRARSRPPFPPSVDNPSLRVEPDRILRDRAALPRLRWRRRFAARARRRVVRPTVVAAHHLAPAQAYVQLRDTCLARRHCA